MKRFFTLMLATALIAGATVPAYADEQAKTKEQIKAEKQAEKEQKKKEKEERRAYMKQAFAGFKQQQDENTTVVTAAEDPVLAPGATDPTGKEATASIVGTWSGIGLYAHAKTLKLKISKSKYTITFRSNGTFSVTEYVEGVRSQSNVGLKIQIAWTETWGGTYKREGNAVVVTASQKPVRKISKYITTGDETVLKAMRDAGQTDEVARKTDEKSYNDASKNAPVKSYDLFIKRHAGSSIVLSQSDYLPILLNRVNK